MNWVYFLRFENSEPQSRILGKFGPIFPANRQFSFARAFGARGILGNRSWAERAENELSVRKGPRTSMDACQ